MGLRVRGATSGEQNSSRTNQYQAWMSHLEPLKAPAWENEAKCSGMDESWFFYEGQTEAVKLYKGQNLCHSCPVKRQCLEAASVVDLYWSVRGGKLPGALKDGGKTTIPTVEKRRKDEKPVDSAGECPRGHERGWKWVPSESRYKVNCFECTNIARARKNAGLPPLPPVAKPAECEFGHNEWVERENHGRRCAACRRYKDRHMRKTGSADGWRDTVPV